MIVRRARESDFAELARLHQAVFAQGWDARALKDLAGGGAVALVAGQPGGIEGFILIRVAADEAEILTLAVALVARRKGRARALVAQAAQAAAEAGATRLYLEVGVGNDAARGLYAGLGFRETGRRAGYYRVSGKPPEDALILAAALPLLRVGK
jgi:ribosomal-protein-alanine N-acetyltransferase